VKAVAGEAQEEVERLVVAAAGHLVRYLSQVEEDSQVEAPGDRRGFREDKN